MSARARSTARSTATWIALLAVAACGDPPPTVAPTADPTPALVAPPAPSGPPETIEILSPGTFRHSEQFVDIQALTDAFGTDSDTWQDPDHEPLVIVAPASMSVADVMPAVQAALQPPGRVHLTLRVVERGRGREATIPVLTGCACRGVHFVDGDAAPEHTDSATTYVFVTARIDGEGRVRTYAIDYDEEHGAWMPGDLPDDLPGGMPPLGEMLDLASLKTWFEALRDADIDPLLCLDYRDSLAAGLLVDALSRAKSMLGPRVLLGPNPREPELEEEFQDDWDAPDEDE